MKPHLRQVATFLTEHERQWLFRQAVEEGRSVSAIIRKLVQGYMVGKETQRRRRLERERVA